MWKPHCMVTRQYRCHSAHWLDSTWQYHETDVQLAVIMQTSAIQHSRQHAQLAIDVLQPAAATLSAADKSTLCNALSAALDASAAAVLPAPLLPWLLPLRPLLLQLKLFSRRLPMQQQLQLLLLQQHLPAWHRPAACSSWCQCACVNTNVSDAQFT